MSDDQFDLSPQVSRTNPEFYAQMPGLGIERMAREIAPLLDEYLAVTRQDGRVDNEVWERLSGVQRWIRGNSGIALKLVDHYGEEMMREDGHEQMPGLLLAGVMAISGDRAVYIRGMRILKLGLNEASLRAHYGEFVQALGEAMIYGDDALSLRINDPLLVASAMRVLGDFAIRPEEDAQTRLDQHAAVGWLKPLILLSDEQMRRREGKSYLDERARTIESWLDDSENHIQAVVNMLGETVSYGANLIADVATAERVVSTLDALVQRNQPLDYDVARRALEWRILLHSWIRR